MYRHTENEPARSLIKDRQMKILNSTDISYKDVAALENLLSAAGLKTTLIDEPPASARVDIEFLSSDTEDKFEQDLEVMVWVDRNPDLLCYGVLLFGMKETNAFKENADLWEAIKEDADDINQTLSAYGTVVLDSLPGISVVYYLTMAGGVASTTVVNTAIEVARGAKLAKWRLADSIEEYSA